MSLLGDGPPFTINAKADSRLIDVSPFSVSLLTGRSFLTSSQINQALSCDVDEAHQQAMTSPTCSLRLKLTRQLILVGFAFPEPRPPRAGVAIPVCVESSFALDRSLLSMTYLTTLLVSGIPDWSFDIDCFLRKSSEEGGYHSRS